MIINLDPMAAVRSDAEDKIAQRFMPAPTDMAHARKRAMAESVSSGGAVPDEFAAAAALEGSEPAALAALILSKPDAIVTRDNDRRRLVLAVRAAKSPAEVDALLTAHNIHSIVSRT